MATIVTRAGKGSALTWTEADANITNLNTDISNIVSGTTAVGAISISTTDGNASDTTMYPVLVGANSTGGQSPHIDGAGLTYNASTNTLTATAFGGALNGTVGATSPNTGVFTGLTAKGTTSTAKLTVDSTALSSTAWTTAGIGLKVQAATYTDTSSAAGTVAASHVHAIAAPTMASTNAITVTDAGTLYISGAPTASTNTTITNGWALLTPGNIKAANMTLTGTLTGTASKATNLVGGNATTLLGSLPYQSNTDTTSLLSPNTTTTLKYLTQVGDGTNGMAPMWSTIASLNNVIIGSTGASTGDFTTLSVKTANDLRLYNSANTYYVGFKAGTLAANKVWTLPSTDGTSGQVLSTDGSGLLSWATAGGGGNNIIILQLGTSDTINLSTTGSTENWTTISTGGVSGVSVSTNTFTLPSGTYFFQMPTITSSSTTYADWKLQNTTDATETARFTSNTISMSGVTKAFYWSPTTVFTIAASKTFRLQTTSGTAVLINGATVNGKFTATLIKTA